MTDKEFRRLSRMQLVEIIYELQNQLAQTRRQLEEAETRLAVRDIKIAEAGTLAEAAMSLNDVLAHAQAAADQYVAQVKRTADQEADRILNQAREEAAQVSTEAQQRAAALLSDARRASESIRARAKQ